MAQVNMDTNAIAAKLARNVQQAVARAAVSMQEALKEKLSHPGSGRFYARHGTTRAIANLPFSELTGRQVNALRHFQRGKYAGLGRNKGLRELGVHQASAPGEPPAPDTGNLRRNVQIDGTNLKDLNFPRVAVGVGGQTGAYGRHLEYGGPSGNGRYVAARPWMRPTAKVMRPRIIAMFQAGNLTQGVK